MTTIDKAIEYYEKEAKQFENVEKYKIVHVETGAGRYVEECRQLAVWLKELKSLREFTKFHDDTLKKGDRVKFKTIGGWYNGGIIIDIDEDRPDGYSYLIEVDELGYTSPGLNMVLPCYVRMSSSTLIKVESEVHCTYTDSEIANSFIEDVEAVKDLL